MRKRTPECGWRNSCDDFSWTTLHKESSVCAGSVVGFATLSGEPDESLRCALFSTDRVCGADDTRAADAATRSAEARSACRNRQDADAHAADGRRDFQF